MDTDRTIIIKRDGTNEMFDVDKIKKRIQTMTRPSEKRYVDADRLSELVQRSLSDQLTSDDLDESLANTVAQFSGEHPVYDAVAGRIAMSRLYKMTPNTFHACVEALNTPPGVRLSQTFVYHALGLWPILETAIQHSRDFDYPYFAVKALERSYLLKKDGKILERPQFMYMRVACALHRSDISRVLDTYELLSSHKIMHASPTLFHAGTKNGQLSSCFLMNLWSNTNGVYETLLDSAKISVGAGGIGMSVSDYPATGTMHKGKISSGIAPVLRLFDASVALTDQGENKRPGAMTIYIEPWHLDILAFLDLKRNKGNETMKARRLFYALWVPDLFMKRVEENESWTLFSPSDVPNLLNNHGRTFDTVYKQYEHSTIKKQTVKARLIWKEILECQIETGGPFILYKDSVNAKNNQEHLGMITNSNLCTEIMQFSSDKETSVCNLASLVLPSFIDGRQKLDFDSLHKATKILVWNLNRVIDTTLYPTASAATNNLKHRPIGVGVQGLSDVFTTLMVPFDSPKAQELNVRIAQTLYHAALEASAEVAEKRGTYRSFENSPTARGFLQFDLWNVDVNNDYFDWSQLRERIKQRGLANSLLIAYMPTAGTTQITGCSEACEPSMSNLYSRRVLSGEYQVISKSLVQCLEDVNLWNTEIRDKILEHRGSVQHIDQIPKRIKEVFRTVWEINPQVLVDMAIARGPFTCQSQSLTLYIEDPTLSQIGSLLFRGWKGGLKTGLYYLRIRSATRATPITLSTKALQRYIHNDATSPRCATHSACMSCSG